MRTTVLERKKTCVPVCLWIYNYNWSMVRTVCFFFDDNLNQYYSWRSSEMLLMNDRVEMQSWYTEICISKLYWQIVLLSHQLSLHYSLSFNFTSLLSWQFKKCCPPKQINTIFIRENCISVSMNIPLLPFTWSFSFSAYINKFLSFR